MFHLVTVLILCWQYKSWKPRRRKSSVALRAAFQHAGVMMDDKLGIMRCRGRAQSFRSRVKFSVNLLELIGKRTLEFFRLSGSQLLVHDVACPNLRTCALDERPVSRRDCGCNPLNPNDHLSHLLSQQLHYRLRQLEAAIRAVHSCTQL